MGSVVVAPELSCPAGCGILVPWPRIEPVSPALEGGLLKPGRWGKSPYQFLSHLLFIQIKSYINPHVNRLPKKKKKKGKQSCFFWKEAEWESGDPGPAPAPVRIHRTVQNTRISVASTPPAHASYSHLCKQTAQETSPSSHIWMVSHLGDLSFLPLSPGPLYHTLLLCWTDIFCFSGGNILGFKGS